jgi:hypothetical protein
MFRHQEFLALLLSLEPLLTIDSKFDNRARLLPSKAEGVREQDCHHFVDAALGTFWFRLRWAVKSVRVWAKLSSSSLAQCFADLTLLVHRPV